MVKSGGDYGALVYVVLNHGLGHICLHYNQTIFNLWPKSGDHGVATLHFVVLDPNLGHFHLNILTKKYLIHSPKMVIMMLLLFILLFQIPILVIFIFIFVK
jgi:hypothetical protein